MLANKQLTSVYCSGFLPEAEAAPVKTRAMPAMAWSLGSKLAREIISADFGESGSEVKSILTS
jgi:hypothetical protein